MLIAFAHGLLLASLVLWLFAALVLPINFATIPRLSRNRREPARWPRVSIVIPARNEERGIARAVSSHLAADYPDFEVLVVNDRSQDRTGEILERLAREDSRLRVIGGLDPPSGWLGKPHALHLGAAQATGALLLFADADVVYDRRALSEAVAFLEVERLDLLAFLPQFEMRGFWENVLMPYLPEAFFFGLGFLANMDSFRSVAAGAGAGNLVRRTAYQAVGGHGAIRASVIDDIQLAKVVKAKGHRCRAVVADDLLSVRMYHGFREVFDGFTKNISFIAGPALGVVLLLMTALNVAASVAPLLLLAVAAAGAAIPSPDVRLAAGLLAFAAILRAALAAHLRYPLWACLTGPLMASVWGAIIVRSFYRRFVRRELLWRGRRYDASRAGF